MPSTKLKAFLLDADVIICLHEMGQWQALCSQTEVVVASTILREVRYYEDPQTQEQVQTDLISDVQAGRIKEIEGTVEDLASLVGLDRLTLEGLHAGEREALALLCSRKAECHGLCSGDKTAIRAAVLLGYGDRCLSLERLLRQNGIHGAVPEHYSERAHAVCLREAAAEYVQRLIDGLGSE